MNIFAGVQSNEMENKTVRHYQEFNLFNCVAYSK